MKRMNMKTLVGASILAALVAAAPAAEPFEAIIEAERYTEKKHEDKNFASVAREFFASGRKAIFRIFMPDGELRYEFEVPRDGVYRFWARYASNGDNRIRWAVDPGAKPDLTASEVTATGGLSGSDAWGWARLGEARLSAGVHTLLVANATLRLDCFYLTDTDKEATDDVIDAYKPKPIDEKTRALLAKPIEPVAPEWLKGAEDYELPEWFDACRVCAHTRLNFQWRDKDVFLTAAERFRSLGLECFVRHIKTGSEGAWWPSKIGAAHEDAKERNWAKEIIDNAHAQDCRIIVYHRHMEDKWLAEQHPDWRCVDPFGEPYTRRGPMVCFNSPYIDFLEKRLLELVEMGADGFYFDEVHMPKEGCWCPFCQKGFKKETGLDAPRFDDPQDPVYHKYIDFKNATIERTFLRYRKTIHAANPEVVLLIGSNAYPKMIERHTTHRLYRIADSMKTEYHLPAGDLRASYFDGKELVKPERDIKIALGYAIARDSADGRPPHVWAPRIKNGVSAVYAVAGMIAHGCVANPDHAEAEIPNPEKFEACIALGNKVSPCFAGTRPLRYAAIHFSELARDRRLPDPVKAWKEVLYPTYGPFAALLRRRAPVGIVTDNQLELGLLDGYEWLVLPAPDDLTEPMRAAVKAFRSRGGRVIAQRPDWQWHSPDGQEKTFEAFLAADPALLAEAPVVATGGNPTMHAVAFEERKGSRRLTVALVNDFDWVHMGRARTRQGEPVDLTGKLAPPVGPCENVEVTVRGPKPARVVEAVTDRALEVNEAGGGWRVAVPDFEVLAVLTAEY